MFYSCIPQEGISFFSGILITERHTVLIEKTFIVIVQGDLQLQQEFSLIIKKLIEAHMIYCYDSTYHSGLSILS